MGYKVSNKDQRALEVLPINLAEKTAYLALVIHEKTTGGGEKKPGITLKLQLFEDDGTACQPLNGNSETVETSTWMPLSGNRFNQYVGALFPEFDEAGGEFDDGDALGRCVVATMKLRDHKNEQDAARFGAQIEVDQLSLVPPELAEVAKKIIVVNTGNPPKSLLDKVSKTGGAKPAPAKPASAPAAKTTTAAAPKPAQKPAPQTVPQGDVDPNDPFGVGAT